MENIPERLERLEKIKQRLHQAAKELSEELNDAPVVVVVGGDQKKDSPATVAGWANIADGREGRFRDILGILQSAIQLESFFHYMEDPFFQQLKTKCDDRSWISRGQQDTKNKDT